ncbi:MAG: hypothetical protein C0615_07520 [Desulfuromonas sp.]|nr:MAG: hypothetical protein C0615_07520 [Desulfuromonas sp.]
MADKNKEQNRIVRAISRRKFLYGSAAVGTLLLGDGFLRQPSALEITSTELATAKLPAGKELRIAHLSDLHLHRFDNYFKKVAETTNRLRPDIILLTGDYIEEARNLDDVLLFLKQLKAPAGIFAVQGNWEYWALIEGEKLQRKLRNVGVRLLINERADIEWHSIGVSLLGIDFPSPAATVERLDHSADSNRVNIALSHVPAFQHELLADKTDLVLCGHTHGGQVRIPGIKPLHLPRHSGPYVDGLYHIGEQKLPLYVSRGIGTSILPVRFCCPPEIGIIRLYGV